MRRLFYLFSLFVVVVPLNAQFFEWGGQVFDIVEHPFVQTEGLILNVDTRVYELEDDSRPTTVDPNLRQLEEMVRRDEQKFIETIVHPTAPSNYHHRTHNQDDFYPLNDRLKQQQQQQQQQHHNHHHQHEDAFLLPSDQSSGMTTPLLLLLIVTPVVFASLLGVAICMVRRRRMFMRGGGDIEDDEERLLKPSGNGDLDLDETAADNKTAMKKRAVEAAARINKAMRPSTWMKIIKRNPNDDDQARTRGGKDASPTDEYKDLCRQRMESDKCSPISSSLCPTNMSNINTPGLSGINSSTINSTPIRITNDGKSSSDSERNSSWLDESSKCFSIDIKTGHVILDFMERHLMDKNLLNDEWKTLCEYEAEPNTCDFAQMDENKPKNRFKDSVPFDHSRVKLNAGNNNNDYINASYIIDDDPKNASYIVTQSPLADTIRDFWSMVWQSESTSIVTLCNSEEYESGVCPKFWPDSSLQVYGQFEIHLVSVHIWCEDYLIRNFLVKNTECSQSPPRTITQFHYLMWPTNGVPSPIKSILEFRRKVKKSHSNHSTPTIVHCNNGIGRTGTYLLIDMVLNKIVKGAKEIDLAATLEYLRDQRANMVNKKYLYEYAFEAITDELKQLLE